MPDDRNWFIAERSEALAFLLLTARPDLSVRKENKQDEGTDFVVALKDSDETLTTKMFVVQVKGTLSSDQKDWAEEVKPLYGNGSHFYLPVCVVIVNVRTNDAAYAWVAEPEMRGGGMALNFVEQPDFHTFTSESLDQIIDRVRTWYDALPRVFASHAS